MLRRRPPGFTRRVSNCGAATNTKGYYGTANLITVKYHCSNILIIDNILKGTNIIVPHYLMKRGRRQLCMPGAVGYFFCYAVVAAAALQQGKQTKAHFSEILHDDFSKSILRMLLGERCVLAMYMCCCMSTRYRLTHFFFSPSFDTYCLFKGQL